MALPMTTMMPDESKIKTAQSSVLQQDHCQHRAWHGGTCYFLEDMFVFFSVPVMRMLKNQAHWTTCKAET